MILVSRCNPISGMSEVQDDGKRLLEFFVSQPIVAKKLFARRYSIPGLLELLVCFS
jgi:hypothetical protein